MKLEIEINESYIAEIVSQEIAKRNKLIELLQKENKLLQEMSYKRLTTESEITDMPTLKALCESCGESGCDEFCEEYQDKGCKDCPVQEAFNRLSAYEDTGLMPEQIGKLKKICKKHFTEEEHYASIEELAEVEKIITGAIYGMPSQKKKESEVNK